VKTIKQKRPNLKKIKMEWMKKRKKIIFDFFRENGYTIKDTDENNMKLFATNDTGITIFHKDAKKIVCVKQCERHGEKFRIVFYLTECMTYHFELTGKRIDFKSMGEDIFRIKDEDLVKEFQKSFNNIENIIEFTNI